MNFSVWSLSIKSFLFISELKLDIDVEADADAEVDTNDSFRWL